MKVIPCFLNKDDDDDDDDDEDDALMMKKRFEFERKIRNDVWIKMAHLNFFVYLLVS